MRSPIMPLGGLKWRLVSVRLTAPAKASEVPAADEMSLGVKGVVDRGVSGKEALVPQTRRQQPARADLDRPTRRHQCERDLPGRA
ncbi:hypothetical protein BREVUG8_10410 [Brevundimonas sp. G8]|nr:hypothetical protein BREVUG8_10410 [Brevundimonas sp. G8]